MQNVKELYFPSSGLINSVCGTQHNVFVDKRYAQNLSCRIFRHEYYQKFVGVDVLSSSVMNQ
jgi:hypothetical protein